MQVETQPQETVEALEGDACEQKGEPCEQKVSTLSLQMMHGDVHFCF